MTVQSKAKGHELDSGTAAHADYMGERQAKARHGYRDIGNDLFALPPIANPDRHEACRLDLLLYLETYHADEFWRAWSVDHRSLVAKLQARILGGGRCAVAMPRSWGKTTIMQDAIEWATFYAHRQYGAIVAASAPMATKILDDMRTGIETSPLLLEDFRLVVYPIVRLEGMPQKAPGQTCDDVRTRIGWRGDRLIMPTVPCSPCPGSIIQVTGITGSGMRGLKHRTADGQSLRPDLLLFDDPQTQKSAWSDPDNDFRHSAMNAAVVGMGGGRRRLAAMAAMTVIAPGDAAERIIKDPEWQGERTKAIYTMPEDSAMKLWDEYYAVKIADLMSGGDGSRATDFYRPRVAKCKQPLDVKRPCDECPHNATCMDRGARIAWPARMEPDQTSGLQFCMDLWLADQPTFMAEFQQEPIPRLAGQGAIERDAAMRKANALKRGVAPKGTLRIAAGFDVHDKLIYWLVIGVSADGSIHVMDYGTFPEQPRRYFLMRDVTRTLRSTFAGTDKEGAILAGLMAVIPQVLDRVWPVKGGEPMQVSAAAVDRRYFPELIEQACRQIARTAVLRPYMGVGIGAKSRPFDQYDPTRTSEMGLHWWIPKGTVTVSVDTNWWKDYTAERIRTAPGDRGGLSLFGQPADHRMLADHWAAEHPIRTEGRGRELNEWMLQGGRDNHWWDVLIYSMAAAARSGIKFGGIEPGTRRKRKVVSIAAMKAARDAANGRT